MPEEISAFFARSPARHQWATEKRIFHPNGATPPAMKPNAVTPIAAGASAFTPTAPSAAMLTTPAVKSPNETTPMATKPVATIPIASPPTARWPMAMTPRAVRGRPSGPLPKAMWTKGEPIHRKRDFHSYPSPCHSRSAGRGVPQCGHTGASEVTGSEQSRQGTSDVTAREVEGKRALGESAPNGSPPRRVVPIPTTPMIKSIRTLLAIAIVATPGFAAFAAEAKRVIVCTVTTGFRHSSIGEAEKTLQKLADESKAFVIVDFVRQPATQALKKPGAPKKPSDPKPDADDKARVKYEGDLKKYSGDVAKYETAMAKWTSADDEKVKASEGSAAAELKAAMAKLSPENLKAQKIDGVIFANTTGDDYPLPDKPGFFKWIEDGGAFMGMHSATDTFKNFAPYYDMLQGTFAGHGAQVPADLIVADAQHPATTGLPAQWDLKQEEMYLIKNHDRSKLRALLYLRHHPNKPEEAGYFPVSWVRQQGKGRVFYTSLGHREDLWSDDPLLKDRMNPIEVSRQFQGHILGGIKWALGLVEGNATPNPLVK